MNRRPQTSWTTPIGDARLNRAHRLAELDALNARTMIRIAQETETADTPIRTAGATNGGERRLRGIPAIGRGVAGHISGTRP